MLKWPRWMDHGCYAGNIVIFSNPFVNACDEFKGVISVQDGEFQCN